MGGAHGATIENCYVNRTVSAVHKDAAGIVGSVFNSTITSCMSVSERIAQNEGTGDFTTTGKGLGMMAGMGRVVGNTFKDTFSDTLPTQENMQHLTRNNPTKTAGARRQRRSVRNALR